MNKDEYIKRRGVVAYEKALQQGRDWVAQHPKEIKAYRQKYYLAHKAAFERNHRNWCKAHPGREDKSSKRWHDKHPLYSRDYHRERIGVTEPLIFQFLDNGFDNDVDSFVVYLRSQNVSEQHISWFKKDVQKFIER